MINQSHMNNSLADIWPEAYSEDFNQSIVTLYLTVENIREVNLCNGICHI